MLQEQSGRVGEGVFVICDMRDPPVSAHSPPSSSPGCLPGRPRSPLGSFLFLPFTPSSTSSTCSIQLQGPSLSSLLPSKLLPSPEAAGATLPLLPCAQWLPLRTPLPLPLVASRAPCSLTPTFRVRIPHSPARPGTGPSRTFFPTRGQVPASTPLSPRTEVPAPPLPGLGPPGTARRPSPGQAPGPLPRREPLRSPLDRHKSGLLLSGAGPHPRPARLPPRHRPAGTRGAVSAGPGCGEAVT